MSPQQAGIPGATIAGLGEETQSLASAQMEIERHIIAAQRQLEAKQGEIALDKHMEQIYADLAKTTNPDEAQAVYENQQREMESVLAPYGKDPRVARALDMYRQQQDISLLHTVNARKAKIITDQDKAVNSLLGEKSMQEGITASRSGGDPSAARTKFELQLQSSVAHGTMTPQDVELEMRNWDVALQKGVLNAAINSPNPSERKQTIEQLKTGKGKLDLSMIDEAARNNFYRHAVEVDHVLTNDEKNRDLNSSLNTLHNAFQSPEYADNHAAQLQALDDADFLRSHGIVTRDGTPDWETAQKLRGYVNASAADHDKLAHDQADKARNDIFQVLNSDKPGRIRQARHLTDQSRETFERAKTDYYPSIVNAIRGYEAEARMEVRADRADKLNQWQVNSWGLFGQIQSQISAGKPVDNVRDIWGKVAPETGLTPENARELIAINSLQKKNASFRQALSMIDHSPLFSANTDETNIQKARLGERLRQEVAKDNLEGLAISERAKKLLDEQGSQSVLDKIKSLFSGPGFLGAQVEIPESPDTPPTKDGETKTNAAGDTVVFKDGKWQLQPSTH